MKTAKAPQKILDAYSALLTEPEEGSKINIQSVCKKANISRSTFYSYFDSIEALNNALMENISKHINAIIRDGHLNVPGQDGYVYIYAQILGYIKQLEPMSRVILLADNNRVLTDSIQSQIQDYLFSYYKNRHETIAPDILERTAVFWTHGVTAMIRDWVKEGCPGDPQEESELMCSAIGTCADFFKKRTYN